MLLVRLLATPSDCGSPRSGRCCSLPAVEFVGGVVLLWIQWWAIAGELVRPPLRPYFIGLGYGNPSAVLTLVTLLAIPAATLATRIRRQRLALATLVAIVVAIGVVAVLSGSRAGWLALAVAFGVVGLAWLVGGDGRAMVGRVATRGRERTVPRAWVAAVVIGVGGAAVAALAFVPSILRRVGAGGEDLRSIFLVTALRLFGESPIVGTGPGTWVTERIAATNAGEIDYYVPHAHDVPAQTLAELGVVGAVAGALLLASVAWLVWRAIRSESTERRWLGYLTAIGLVYFSIHNVLDFYANMPAALFAVALPIACLDATTDEKTTAFGRVRAWLERPGLHVLGRWVLAGTCVLAVPGLLVHEASAAAGDRAVAAADAGLWLTAFEQASLAAARSHIHAYALTAACRGPCRRQGNGGPLLPYRCGGG
jgi:O-antigen ligase